MSFTRVVAGAYAASLLAAFVRVQLNIYGGYQYIQSTKVWVCSCVCGVYANGSRDSALVHMFVPSSLFSFFSVVTSQAILLPRYLHAHLNSILLRVFVKSTTHVCRELTRRQPLMQTCLRRISTSPTISSTTVCIIGQ